MARALALAVAVLLAACRPENPSEGMPPNRRFPVRPEIPATEAPPPEAPQEPVAVVPDSVPVTFDELAAAVAPLTEALAATRAELAPHAGTPAADSIFLAFSRGALPSLVRAAAARLAADRFEAAVWSGGGAAQRLRRARGFRVTDPRDPARSYGPPEERARADSMSAFLAARGLRVMQGEGQVHYQANEAALLERFGPYVSAETRAYLELRRREQDEPTAADASLMITQEELGDRLLAAHALLTRYPRSPWGSDLRARCDAYLRVFIRGMDNYPFFDDRTGDVLPARRAALEQFVARHGDSEPGRIVNAYLGLLTANDFMRTDAVRDAPFECAAR